MARTVPPRLRPHAGPRRPPPGGRPGLARLGAAGRPARRHAPDPDPARHRPAARLPGRGTHLHRHLRRGPRFRREGPAAPPAWRPARVGTFDSPPSAGLWTLATLLTRAIVTLILLPDTNRCVRSHVCDCDR